MREPKLTTIRGTADALAKGRSASTAHLLAAIASKPGTGATMLRERRLDVDVLLQAARVLTDDRADAVDRAMRRAGELAAQASRPPGGVHLLAALLEERTTAAYRAAVVTCGYWGLPAAAKQLATMPGRAPAPSSVAAHDGRLIPASVLARLDD